MNSYLKAAVYLGFLVVLHFLYDVTHFALLAPISGTSESVFQHMKMAFWAYLAASLVESLSVRDKGAFSWYPRLLSAVSVPWFVVVVWYIVPAFVGKGLPVMWEILWATLVTYLSGIMGGVVDKAIAKDQLATSFRIVVVILALVSALLYVWFTYRPPWIDVFVNPELL